MRPPITIGLLSSFVLTSLAISAEPPATTPPPLAPLLLTAAGKPIQDRDAWQSQRTALRKKWQDVIGAFPEPVPLATKVISTEELPDHTRLLIRYQADASLAVDAYLLIPRQAVAAGEKRPAMVVLHPTTKNTISAPIGLAERESSHNALHLVRRGYVCIVPKNILWSYEGESIPQATATLLADKTWKTGMAKMTWDAIRAVDVLCERAEVDPARIGCFGHSLGAKEVLYLAAFDERIRAAISCEGGIGLTFSNWDADWYLGQQIKAADFPLDHQQLLALVAPRAFMLIGGGSADGPRSQPYIDAVRPVWKLYNAVDRLAFVRHTYGHDFLPPGPEREHVYDWLDRQMGVATGASR